MKRVRKRPLVDVGALRVALGVYAVDRPVAIRLPDGREFPIAEVRLDCEGASFDAAAVHLVAARVDDDGAGIAPREF